jgi:phosphopantothenoylcysteine synthetase/decarboxylase
MSPRFSAQLAVKQGSLYLFGGLVEDGDKQITLNDFYCLGKLFMSVYRIGYEQYMRFAFLDLHKQDEWQTLIESDFKEMEWFDSDSDSEDDDDEEDDDEEEDEMDTQ